MKGKKTTGVRGRHGMAGTAINKIWIAMRQRCSNPNYSSYKHYGGRGIKVCDRWNIFANFYADMGDRPKGKTLDRIDNNGNYEPNNCRWATHKEQHSNTRANRFYEHDGVRLTMSQWAARLGIKCNTIMYRLDNWPVATALTASKHGVRHAVSSTQVHSPRKYRSMKHSKSFGFSLLELMIVCAIIGILASIAIPAYMDYTVRAQVSEGLSLATAAKVAIVENYTATGEFPANIAATGAAFPASGKYVESVEIADGVIVITYGGESSTNISTSGSNVLALAPSVSAGGELVWVCGRAAQPAGGTAQGDAAALTTIVNKFLPQACRS